MTTDTDDNYHQDNIRQAVSESEDDDVDDENDINTDDDESHDGGVNDDDGGDDDDDDENSCLTPSEFLSRLNELSSSIVDAWPSKKRNELKQEVIDACSQNYKNNFLPILAKWNGTIDYLWGNVLTITSYIDTKTIGKQLNSVPYLTAIPILTFFFVMFLRFLIVSNSHSSSYLYIV
jgi:hypothetical protein